jgi:hypothetical protein
VEEITSGLNKSKSACQRQRLLSSPTTRRRFRISS